MDKQIIGQRRDANNNFLFHPRLSVKVTTDCIIYKPDPITFENWLANPYSFSEESELVAFLAQIEEEGYAQLNDNKLLLAWKNLYQLLESKEYNSSIKLLQIPEIKPWRPILSSRGGLTDDNFSIAINGWVNPLGRTIAGNVQINGAILSFNQEIVLLPKDAYDIVIAVAAFHIRQREERNPDSNRRAWAVIRRSAIKSGAELSDFLRKTLVITPDHLKLTLRKTSFGESKMVEVLPSFEGVPERWLEIFDRFDKVQNRYDIPDKEGIVHVIISHKVKKVLDEIKQMRGRRVAGDRAEAFIRNPFATLGPDAEKVLDPEEFEDARRDAGISFARFTARVLYDEQGFPYDIALLIEESLNGDVTSCKLSFENIDDLHRFIDKLEDRINNSAQCCHWEGYDLEILGDTPDQLILLKKALIDRQRRDTISHAEIFDLSHYSERIEGFGIEKPYYSPYIARKDDGDSWIPENVAPVLVWTPPGSEEQLAILMTSELHSQFKERLHEAKDKNNSSFDFPGCSKQVPVEEATEILKIWDEAIKDVNKGTFKPKKGNESSKPNARLGLVVKPNINTLDYFEQCDSLALPDNVTPLLPSTLKADARLKDHQLQGVAWLQHLWSLSPEHCRGAVLADDMGLGKTLQLLTFMAKCIEDDPNIDPFLIVAPVSLLENWKEEYNKFFEPESFSILKLYGSSIADKRISPELIDEELKGTNIKRLLRPNWIGDAKIVLTTYETLRDLEFSLAREKWSAMICDEAQKIKNPNALVTRAAKKQNVRLKIACTGTPVENTLTDLWCLFDFIQPGLLGALNYFGTRYRRPIEAETDEDKKYVEELRSIISPQMLRRTKVDVAKDLPKKITVPDCRELQISKRQRDLYGIAISQFRIRDSDGAGSTFKNHLGVLQYLRRLCSDPVPKGQVSTTNEPLAEILKHSPKMAWLMSALESISNKNEKAIIFCEFRDLQRKLQRCIAEQFNFVADMINGDTPAESRQRRLDGFQQKLGFGVIILSPLAIGFGVNIQKANHVIHFTRTWNPAKEDQATDRVYRIGQTKEVYVYYPVVVADFTTFDAKLDKLLEWKRGLSKDVLNGTGELSPADFGDIEDIDGSNVFGDDFISPKEIDTLSPTAFEAFCAVLWAKQGYSKTYRTPRSGDSGVDVVAIKGNQGVLIQCKTSSQEDKQLGWDAVKDVIAGTEVYKRRHPDISKFQRVAVTNQFFNDNARHQADINNVILIDREKLVMMLANVPLKKIDLEKYLVSPWE